MKDPTRLKDLILEKVDLAQVMLGYNVGFTFDPTHADEVQYKCPFHGKDNKPSARFYRSTNSCYCWVCMKKWDPISFVMDKEKMRFIQALGYIVTRYSVDTSSIPDDPEFLSRKSDPVSESRLTLESIRSNIREMRGKIEFSRYRALCYAWFMVMFEASQEKDVSVPVGKLKLKLKGMADAHNQR